MAVTTQLIERSGELKQALVQFGTGERYRTDLDEWLARHAPRGEAGLVNTVDAFLLQHPVRYGRTVVDEFIEEHPELSRADRELLLSWRDVVEGVFLVKQHEGDALQLFNLVDELTYRAHSNMGPAALAVAEEGYYLAGRLVPIAGEWLVSGVLRVYPPSERDTAGYIAAELASKSPRLVFRNPQKLALAWKLQREDREEFLRFFGSDLVVVPGRELPERMQAFLHFKVHEVRQENGLTRAEQAQQENRPLPPLTGYQFDSDLLEAETVGLIYDEAEGLNYCPDFGLVEEAFANPELAEESEHREVVEAYIRSPDISPLPIRRLAERYPKNVNQVFVKIFPVRRSFNWKQYGESFLQRYKFGRYSEPPLPDFVPLSDELSQALTTGRAAQALRNRRVGRNDPCPCGSGAKYKRCCGRRG